MGGSLNQDHILSTLVDRAYEAALDDSLWAEWTVSMTEALGGSSSLFAVVDGQTGALLTGIPHGLSNRTVDDYFSGMAETDPQVAFVNCLSGITIFEDDAYQAPGMLSAGQLDYVRWENSIANIQHHLSAAIPLSGGAWRAGFSIHRSAALGPTPREERRKLEALLPDITRALNLGLVHREKLVDGYWRGLTRSAGEAVILLDDRGRVMRLTAAAEAFVRRGDGPTLRQDQLGAWRPDDENALDAMVRAAIAPHQGRGGAVRIARSTGRQPYIASAYPLPRERQTLSILTPAAILILIDPTEPQPGDDALLVQSYQLTPREAEIAALLMAGHSIESAAASLSIAHNTARVHLQRLLQKTGTTRQADLVRIMARLRAAHQTRL